MSCLVPTQEVDHTGFTLNLKKGLLQVPVHKLKGVRRELGKLVVKEKNNTQKNGINFGGLSEVF